ncbi:MAG: hypothetical protein KC621_23440 [Myxococcales bacterium]|nr:hypothetical protein [Myxococcales bacterium]
MLGALWIGVASAATVVVGPGGYGTVAAGVAAANPGDVVEIAAGTWVGAVTVVEPITLRGAGRGQTVLRATGAGPVLTLSDDVTVESLTVDGQSSRRAVQVRDAALVRFDGISVENGSSTVGAGGLEVGNNVDRIEIVGSLFRANTGRDGGGLVVWGTGGALTEVSITRSLFRDNQAGTSSFAGGAVYLSPSSVTVDRVAFVDNSAGGAGALFVDTPTGEVRIVGSRFCENRSDHWSAVTVPFAHSRVIVAESIFAANDGGIYVGDLGYYVYFPLGSLTVVESTFVANTAPPFARSEAAIDVGGSLRATIVDDVFADNVGSAGGGGVKVWSSAANRIDHNLWWNNSPVELRSASTGAHAVFADPELLGFSDDGDCYADDFTLGSAVVDAGDPSRPLDSDGTVQDIGPRIH